MKLWQSLYVMTWIVFIEFLLVLVYRGSSVLIYSHSILGVAIVGLAFYNFSGLRNTRIAGRVKRTAQACFYLSIVLAVLGVPLLLGVGSESVIPLINMSIYRLMLVIHLVIALAVITQAAAVAIAHDMWEDREFAEETEPGSVPPMPKP
ncbi:MAG TPA: hypothetical protein VJ574_06755 [Candidatus Bathyarchaeia archaeon]|nr:MAG: hypothetical protein A3K70_00100 [Candidatus Bathyarchaeota archaeon RBG_16_48_13]HJX24081.1 hypothetical protein [Candidatus Bathyarchaeia archaeon]